MPELTVAENMFLNAEPTRFGLIDRPRGCARARRALDGFRPRRRSRRRRWASLDLATQQLVVIARALSKKARLLILDEPTAALTENEAQRLFERMRALTARGVAIIFVSHRLARSSRSPTASWSCATAGSAAATRRPSVSRDSVVGADDRRRPHAPLRAAQPSPATIALEVEDLTVFGPGGPTRVRVDSRLAAVRAGRDRRPVRPARCGLHRGGARALRRLARPVERQHPRRRPRTSRSAARRRGGARHRPDGAGPARQPDAATIRCRQHRARQPRRDHAVAAFSTSAPASAGAHGSRATGSTSRRRRSTSPVGTLSGGNQQKVQVARWLARRCADPDPDRPDARRRRRRAGARSSASGPSWRAEATRSCSPRPRPRSWSRSATGCW